MSASLPEIAPAERRDWSGRSILATIGVLPLVILACLAFFGIWEARFLSGENIFNLVRQSSYLIIACIAQMIVLITGGIDLSVGAVVALVSVITATVMAGMFAAYPDAVGLSIAAGILAGLGASVFVGIVNGFGVSVLRVTPFIMTLGSFSMASGMALFITGGYGVYGMPTQFGDAFSDHTVLGIPVPILYAALVCLAAYVLLNWSRSGRYFYSIGSNPAAARLSGVNTIWQLILAYAISGLVVGITGVLLTARTETGEATLGGTDLVLKSIAACVIGGASPPRLLGAGACCATPCSARSSSPGDLQRDESHPHQQLCGQTSSSAQSWCWRSRSTSSACAGPDATRDGLQDCGLDAVKAAETVDSRRFREGMSRVAAAVHIVAIRDGDAVVGVTATAVCSLLGPALEPADLPASRGEGRLVDPAGPQHEREHIAGGPACAGRSFRRPRQHADGGAVPGRPVADLARPGAGASRLRCQFPVPRGQRRGGGHAQHRGRSCDRGPHH